MNQFFCVLMEGKKRNYFSVKEEKICDMIRMDWSASFFPHFQCFLKKFNKGKTFNSCWFELRSANKFEFRKDLLIFHDGSEEESMALLRDLKKLMENDSINFLDTYHQGLCVILSHFKSDEHIYDYFGNLLIKYAKENQEEK